MADGFAQSNGLVRMLCKIIIGEKEFSVSHIGISDQLPQRRIDGRSLVFSVLFVHDAEFAIPVAAAAPVDGDIAPSFL